ncbi:MAG: helix-turn-helix transcriptional regulator [Lachnospiraceae bacterium]|nr:helix-turn-helix transcriptional regulator [Lachnospiraceae bacterium]
MSVLETDITRDVLDHIKFLMDIKGWTTYRLAEEADVQQSIIYNMFRRKTLPRIDTLERICKGLGITLCDFFVFTTDENDCGPLTNEERRLVEISRCLKEERSMRLNALAEGMLEAQNLDNKK